MVFRLVAWREMTAAMRVLAVSIAGRVAGKSSKLVVYASDVLTSSQGSADCQMAVQNGVIPFWILNGDQVRKWWDAGSLGTATKISRVNALKLIAGI